MKSALACALLLACGHGGDAARDPAEPEAPDGAALVVTSSAFTTGGSIPSDHTCEGADVAPALAWSGAPPTTKSFAIVVDDPDAPKQTWVHWIVTGLPASTTSLATGAALPAGAATGKNDFGKLAWGGPCPPNGVHRYDFKVYALDIPLDRAGLTKPELLAAIRGHVVARGALMGRYEKRR